MQYKIVDKKAPRFRKTNYETRLVVSDLHEEFVKQTGIEMDLKTFRAIYNENMEVIKHFIETERNGVVLPEQMGNVHLAFFKMKRKAYDYMTGMATGKAPANQNFETDGLQGKIYWDYKELKYKPKEYRLYGFIGCRDLKQRASQAFINTPYIFRKYIYDAKKDEKLKIKQLLERERNDQGSNKSTESVEQGSELRQSID